MGDEDGHKILRKEIDDSMRRVRAAKKGNAVAEVSPRHESCFYFPDQRKYFQSALSYADQDDT